MGLDWALQVVTQESCPQDTDRGKQTELVCVVFWVVYVAGSGTIFSCILCLDLCNSFKNRENNIKKKCFSELVRCHLAKVVYFFVMFDLKAERILPFDKLRHYICINISVLFLIILSPTCSLSLNVLDSLLYWNDSLTDFLSTTWNQSIPMKRVSVADVVWKRFPLTVKHWLVVYRLLYCLLKLVISTLKTRD